MKKLFSRVLIVLFLIIILFSISGCKKKVKFNVNFYVENQIYEVVGTNGKEVIEMPINPTKDGYTFEGWYWDEGTWFKPFTAQSLVQTPLKEDMNVYAYFLDEDAPRGTDLKFKDGVLVEHDGIGDTYLVIVSNSTIAFSFTDYVDVSNKSTWTVSTDMSGNNTIASKTVELEVGNNLYFVQVFDSETNKVKQYNVAVRRRPIYTVYFDTNGGTSCSMQRVEEDSLVTEPTTSKTGYTFTGWDYNFDTPLKSDIVISASWSPNQYTITFDANGGSLSSNQLKVTYDKSYTLPIPIRPGYTFNGWYENNNKVTDGTWYRTSNVSLVAKWTANTYYIIYNLNGGTISSTKPSSYTYGTTKTISNPSKIGYEFIGWTVNNSTQKYKDYQISDTTYGDLELVANYKPNVYTVTLDSNGGTCDKSYIMVEYNSKFELPVPSRLGYTFNGWYNGSSKVENGTWTKTSSLDLTAKWSITNYKITYKLDGATNSINNPSSYTFETSTILLEEPSKTGYTFIGWSTNENQTPMLNVEITKGSHGDKEFTANFIPNKYKVTFDVNSGDELENSTLEYTFNNYYTLPTPTKTGYNFTGWYNGDKKVEAGNWGIAADVTLIAKWSIITYTIKYNLDGGVNSNLNYTSYNYEYDDIAIINPTKTGYTFTGWKVNGNDELVTELVIKHNSTGDIVLNANFIPNLYKLNLDVNGGENISISSFDINYDEKFELPSPSRVGYTFDGWYNGTTKVNSGTWKYLTNLDLTAKWSIINYTITYNLDGGKNNSYNPSKYNYEYEDITINEPTKTGYTFIGWTYDDVLVPVKELVIKHNSTGNLTLTANFQINTYYIKYDVNGGNELGETTISVVYNTNYELVEPSRIGYTFDGWYNGTTKVNGGTWKYLKDLDLTAKWSIINYTITYNLDGGENNINNPLTYTYEDATIILQDPYKKGHTFIGWISDEIFIPTKELQIPHNNTKNLCFTAVFEVNTYTITFDVNGGEELDCNEIEVLFGDYVELPTPSNGKLPFAGWYYDGSKVMDGEWNIDGDITLFAEWINLYDENGKTYVNLGRYPQTVVTDSTLISNLNNISKINELGYIEYNGEEYKKVTASPYSSDYTFLNGNSVVNGGTYYFKVEPIKWRVIYNTDGTYKLLSEYILDNTFYFHSNLKRSINGKNIYSNNYEYSNIRAWLNGYNGSGYNVDDYTNKGFIDIAFSNIEKTFINTTIVDNSQLTVPNYVGYDKYLCSDTVDMVYLLSYADFDNSSYDITQGNETVGFATDYAICKGLKIYTKASSFPTFSSVWWTRSPLTGEFEMYVIDGDGGRKFSNPLKSMGVRPALDIICK